MKRWGGSDDNYITVLSTIAIRNQKQPVLAFPRLQTDYTVLEEVEEDYEGLVIFSKACICRTKESFVPEVSAYTFSLFFYC